MKKVLQSFLFIFPVLIIYTILSLSLDVDTGLYVSELEFTTYDNVLYTPEELHALTEEEKSQGYVGWDYSYYNKEFSRVRTNQLILHLTPGKVYGLYSGNLTYAAKLWVDGVLLCEQGQVSETEENFKAYSGSMVVYFTAGEETEIVLQRSNFNHANWNIAKFQIGEQAVITRMVQASQLHVTLLMGFLLTLFLINFGMFIGIPERKSYFWFALACFFTMLVKSFTNPKPIMILFPYLNWYVGYRIEKLSLILLLICMLLFMEESFKKLVPKWVVIVNLSGGILLGVLLIVLPTKIYTKANQETELLMIVLIMLYMSILLFRAFRHWKHLTGSQKFYLGGVLVFIGCALVNVFGINVLFSDMIELGLVLFELVLTVALALEYKDVREAYQQSMLKEEQLTEMNQSMEESQRLQENFMAIMNHEMRTPLTVIAGYAALSTIGLNSKDPADAEMIRNLELIKKEALRLGRIVEQSDEGARATMVNGKIEDVPVKELFEAARDFCRPILEKRSNEITISYAEGSVIPCIKDSMLQVLYNLILNASRHTSHGLIRLTCTKQERSFELSVIDDGEGMDEETRLHAFERGYSKDGGHGLGLALCREIAEKHNGSIRIEENRPAGTKIIITIPDRKEES